jgi:hypothetical protein
VLDEREYAASLDAMERVKQVINGMYADGDDEKTTGRDGQVVTGRNTKLAVRCKGPQAATAWK